MYEINEQKSLFFSAIKKTLKSIFENATDNNKN